MTASQSQNGIALPVCGAVTESAAPAAEGAGDAVGAGTVAGACSTGVAGGGADVGVPPTGSLEAAGADGDGCCGAVLAGRDDAGAPARAVPAACPTRGDDAASRSLPDVPVVARWGFDGAWRWRDGVCARVAGAVLGRTSRGVSGTGMGVADGVPEDWSGSRPRTGSADVGGVVRPASWPASCAIPGAASAMTAGSAITKVRRSILIVEKSPHATLARGG